MKIFFILLFFFTSPCVYSQIFPSVPFDSSVYDFGTIKEIDGKVSHKFHFINGTDTPIVIRKVEASCGCTDVDWSKEPVLPRDSGFVSVIFDPTNRPGNFNKTLIVTSNCRKSRNTVKIKGVVIPKFKTILDNYPYEFPSGIRLEYDCLTFMRVNENSIKRVKFHFYNNNSSSINVSIKSLPPFLRVIDMSKDIESRNEGYILLEFDTSKVEQLGTISEKVDLYINSVCESIFVKADIHEDFSTLSKAELNAAPRISVSNSIYNFGELKEGDCISGEFIILNKGQSDLIIRRVYTMKKFSYTLSSYRISPSGSSEMKVIMPTIGMKGKQNIVVKIISNTPSKQEIQLRFIGFIK